MATIIETILETYPVLASDVWMPLQSRSYAEAGDNLELILSNFDPYDWESVDWEAIIKGYPLVRGAITEQEWGDNVLPIIIQAILNSARTENIISILRGLEPGLQKKFVENLLNMVPSKNLIDKLNWLKTKNPSLSVFILATPSQVLGFSPLTPITNLSPREIEKRYMTTPTQLRDRLLTYASAEDVMKTGKDNHLSEEKISALAWIVGKILMGFVNTADFTKEVKKTLDIDERIAITISDDLHKKIFSDLINDLRGVYNPPVPVVEERVFTEIKPSPEKFFSFGPFAEEKKSSEKTEISPHTFPNTLQEGGGVKMEPGEPLIIHEEKSVVEEKRKPSFFSFPLNLIKPGTRIIEEVPIRARVEAPKEKRVVHYSELRTPLSPFNKGGDNSVKFTPPEKAQKIEIMPEIRIPEEILVPIKTEAPKTPPTKPATQSKIKGFWRPEQVKESVINGQNNSSGSEIKSQPKIEGNIVDLR